MWLMKTSLIKREQLNIFKKEKLPYKLTNDHEVNALKYMHERATEKVTINDLQIYLNNNPSLNKISRTGAYILLKKVTKYSYKKSHKIPKKMKSKEKYRELCEAIYLQYYFQTNGYHTIYVDEFHTNFK